MSIAPMISLRVNQLGEALVILIGVGGLWLWWRRGTPDADAPLANHKIRDVEG